MSYILDALKKAAEQRDRQAPVLKRLLGPSATPRSVWARAPGRLLAALVLNASLLAVLLVIWLRPMATVAPPEAVDVAAPATSPSPQSSALEPQRTMEMRERRAAPRERPAPEPPRLKPATTPAPTPAPPPAARPVPERPAPTTQEAPAPAVAPHASPAAPPTSPSLAGLRLEALIYSEVPEKRMIFVNGRKYVEGDTIEDRLRVEEIREDGVALSGEGHRVTLGINR